MHPTDNPSERLEAMARLEAVGFLRHGGGWIRTDDTYVTTISYLLTPGKVRVQVWEQRHPHPTTRVFSFLATEDTFVPIDAEDPERAAKILGLTDGEEADG